MGLKAGDREAGLTVLLVADGIDWKSCSNELAAPWPSWEPKSCCENVTGFWKDGEVLATTPAPCRNFWISSRSVRFIC
jgi:hypothetical protein